MESFFGTIKTESLHHYRFGSHEQARQVVFEYIEVFYNRIRRHAKIGNRAPADCAAQFCPQATTCSIIPNLPIH
jgi:putative transposase